MAAPLGSGWAPHMVRDVFKHAFRVLSVSVGSVWPKREGSGMPLGVCDDLEVWLDRNVPGWRAGGETEYERFSAEEVTMMEEVIRWQFTYLVGYETALRPNPQVVLAVWLRTHHRRGLFRRVREDKMGWGEALAKRRLDQAWRIICMGLMGDGIRPPSKYYEEEEPVVGSWKEAMAPPPVPVAPPEPGLLPDWWHEVAAIADRSKRNTALWYQLEADMPQAPGAGALRMAQFYRYKRMLQ